MQDESAIREAWEESQRNVSWRDAHAAEVEQHAGQWVCIAEQRIVVAERDPDRFVARLQAGDWRQDGSYIFYVPTKEEWDSLGAPHVPVRVVDRTGA
ncbi:MAG: hypothetical protein ACRDI2_21820 [Chloroflexota bacterium]